MISGLIAYLLSMWTWILVAIVASLLAKLLMSRKNKANDWAVGIPEVKGHWFFGNLDPSLHLSATHMKHYKALKGLRFGLWHEGGRWAFGSETRLVVLDPDLITKIQISDHDCFTDTSFIPEQYTKVSR